MGKEIKVDVSPEGLKEQVVDLSEEQNDEIARQADEEYDKEHMSEEEFKKKKDDEKAEEEENKTEEEKEAEEAKQKKADEEEEAKEKEAKEKEAKENEENKGDDDEAKQKEKDKQKEEEEEAKKAKELEEGLTDEQKAEIEKQEQDQIKIIVEKEEVSEEEAKEILEKDKSIIKKYKGSPYELSRGYRNLQSLQSKTQKDLDTAKSQIQDSQREVEIQVANSAPTVKSIADGIRNGVLKDDKGNVFTEGHIIKSAKEEHPTATKDMDDDEVLEFASEKILTSMKTAKENYLSNLKTEAGERREKLLSDLPESDVEFKKEIKSVLDKVSDARVVSSNFILKDVVRWAKGDKLDALKKDMEAKVKKAYSDGVKKGEENAKVLGEKPPVGGDGKPPKKKGSDNASLTPKEQQRARDMFESTGMEEAEMFKSYKEIYPDGEDDL